MPLKRHVKHIFMAFGLTNIKEGGINTNLKELRILVGMTQEEVAKEVGVTGMAYRRWEYGEVIPNAKYIKPLAKALNCDVEEILCLFK